MSEKTKKTKKNPLIKKNGTVPAFHETSAQCLQLESIRNMLGISAATLVIRVVSGFVTKGFTFMRVIYPTGSSTQGKDGQVAVLEIAAEMFSLLRNRPLAIAGEIKFGAELVRTRAEDPEAFESLGSLGGGSVPRNPKSVKASLGGWDLKFTRGGNIRDYICCELLNASPEIVEACEYLVKNYEGFLGIDKDGAPVKASEQYKTLGELAADKVEADKAAAADKAAKEDSGMVKTIFGWIDDQAEAERLDKLFKAAKAANPEASRAELTGEIYMARLRAAAMIVEVAEVTELKATGS